MASDEHYQRRHERRRTIDDVFAAQLIACQAGNETLVEILVAELIAGVEPIQNERRESVSEKPIDRSCDELFRSDLQAESCEINLEIKTTGF